MPVKVEGRSLSDAVYQAHLHLSAGSEKKPSIAGRRVFFAGIAAGLALVQ
jgi:hypothetical protein